MREVVVHFPPLGLAMVMHDVSANFAPHFAPSPPSWGWCVIPNPSIDGVVAGVSINLWNAKRHFLERG